MDANRDEILSNLKQKGMEEFKSNLYIPVGCYGPRASNDSSKPIYTRRFSKSELEKMLGKKVVDFELACKSDPTRDIVPIGRSGHTIGTGFDIGQKTQHGLKLLFGGAPVSLNEALRKNAAFKSHIHNPTASMQDGKVTIPDGMSWVDLSNADVVNSFDLVSRLSLFAKDYHGQRPDYKKVQFSVVELTYMDNIVLNEQIRTTTRLYDKLHPEMPFASLAANYKTALLSLVFQGRYNIDRDIFELEARGKWAEAADKLNSRGGDYALRRKSEAGFILKQISLSTRILP
jgi:hypothetical protein